METDFRCAGCLAPIGPIGEGKIFLGRLGAICEACADRERGASEAEDPPVACGTFDPEAVWATRARLQPRGPASAALGVLVRGYRKRAGLYLGNVAELLGRDVVWLSRLENGRGEPLDLFDALRLGRAIGADLAALLLLSRAAAREGAE
jgi:hypothetical protein